MKKNLDVSKEVIIYVVSLTVFTLIWGIVSLFCDAANNFTGVSPDESTIFIQFIRGLGMTPINASSNTFVQLLCLMGLNYLTFGIGGVFTIMHIKEKKPIKPLHYIIFVICFLISSFLPLVFSLFGNAEELNSRVYNFVTFSGQSFLMALFMTIAIIVACALVFVLVFYSIKLFHVIKEYYGKQKIKSEVAKAKEKTQLADEVSKQISASAGGLSSDQGVSGEVDGEIFVGLKKVDEEETNVGEKPIVDDPNLTLSNIAMRFRNYLAAKHSIYFDISIIRGFLAAFGTSRLIILEGLSGTGKSSLPRFFSEFIGEEVFFVPVQATWRDRSNLLGYYNDFSKSFKETDFLINLYRAGYNPNHINIMVLDELNLSRIEYYFADFLSILEYPSADWKMTLMQIPEGYEEPKHLHSGVIQIPDNTWFVGTANVDDSTYLITDKVYDRAIVLDFEDRNAPFSVDGPCDKISLSASRLKQLFNDAIQNKEYQFNESDYNKFHQVCDFTYDAFNITFGNRIMNQIALFVPCYVALGGKKEDALDIMFSKKILRKIEGRYEDYIYKGLTKLEQLINKVYGEGVFVRSEKAIQNLLKKAG